MNVLLIQKDHQILLSKRPEKTVLGGLYELPNVPAEGDISTAFEEKYGIRIQPGKHLQAKDHIFTHITWHMQLIEGTIMGSLPENLPEGLLLADETHIKEQIMLPTAFRKLLS